MVKIAIQVIVVTMVGILAMVSGIFYANIC
jgi:hypothetical protein